MAPKRSGPPPPPTPPAASSEETGSGSEYEEEEEEIAHSPPPAGPRSVAPPQQQEDQEPEASDEDEDGEEEEEEDEKANHVIPSAATKNPPPPPLPPTREESDASDEEEEEEEEGEAADDEMPQTKPAPNQAHQEMEAKGAKRSGAPFQRTWSTDDEFRILEALAAHRLEHGTLPQMDSLADALAGKLDKSGCSLSELQRKVRSLYSRISKAAKKGAPPSKEADLRLFDLFKKVWPSVTRAPTKAATKVAPAANSGAGREPDELCELYPYLAEEVKALQKAHPGLFKREFAMIDDSKASALDEKIKRHRHAQMRLHLRGHDLTKEVTKTLMHLAGCG